MLSLPIRSFRVCKRIIKCERMWYVQYVEVYNFSTLCSWYAIISKNMSFLHPLKSVKQVKCSMTVISIIYQNCRQYIWKTTQNVTLSIYHANRQNCYHHVMQLWNFHEIVEFAIYLSYFYWELHCVYLKILF